MWAEGVTDRSPAWASCTCSHTGTATGVATMLGSVASVATIDADVVDG